MRPWKEYGDPAFTGLWAQTLQSSMIPLRRGSTSMMPAFPAVERIIVDAEAIRRGEATGKETAISRSLASAFGQCLKAVDEQYPGGDVERREEDNVGHWVHLTGGRLTGMIHMPAQAQKVLSKPYNVRLAKRARAATLADTSVGSHGRKERAEETCAEQAGHVWRAHPWQDSSTLSLASHEMLVQLIWRYDLDAPAGLQPPRECKHPTCCFKGPEAPERKDTAERVELAMLAKREWLKHAVRSCKWNNGVRRLCHDAILKVVRDMMESAGFEDVVIEDRWWDEGDGEAQDTRRPDITAFNPRTRRRYVLDIVGAWASKAGGEDEDGQRVAGHAASGKERGKVLSYRGAMKRQDEGGLGWLVRHKAVAKDVFVPFGFEVGGALGAEAEGFLAECVRVAEWKNQGVGDLAFWSSITWGGHWRERIGVEIARGVARCVEKAATGGWGGSAATSGRHHEFDRDCC